MDNALVRRAAYALVALALLGGGALVFTHRAAQPQPLQPGEADYREAAGVVIQEGLSRTTFGELALAEAFQEQLAALPQVEVRPHVYAERGGPGVCFLIGLPGQRLALDQRAGLLKQAWALAERLVGEGQLAVALQGKLTLQGVAMGRPGAEPQVTTGVVVPAELFAYFVRSGVAPTRSGVAPTGTGS